VRALRSVGRRADLLQPESAKAYLAGAELSEGRKAVIVQHLARFYTYKQIPFDKPRYLPVDSLPFVPLHSLVSQIGYLGCGCFVTIEIVVSILSAGTQI
jgi:hypothetical protein